MSISVAVPQPDGVAGRRGEAGAHARAPRVSLRASHFDVLELLADGASLAQIEQRLGLQRGAVEFEIGDLLRRLGVRNGIDAVPDVDERRL